MSDMIEQVALAMALSDGDYEVMDHWRRRAHAAIEAMREPTEEMIEAASLENTNRSVYVTMIDAALENKSV